MAKTNEAPDAKLRHQAEAQLAAGQGTAAITEEEPLKLLHELQVHQVELELQNAELLQARDETATLLEQYTDLYDFAPVGYFTLDPGGTIRSSNLTGAGLLGVERARLNGRHFRQFLIEADRPAFASFLDQIFLSTVKVTCDAALLAKEHSPRSVQIEAVAAASGEQCRLAVIDITQRKRAEEELRVSGERYRLLADTMLQGVVHHDRAGTIIAMNPAAERILGKSREEFLGGSSVTEEYHTIRETGEPFPGLEHPSMVALRTGHPERGVVMGIFNPKLGEFRWISVDAVPVFRPGEPSPAEVYTVFEDITKRRLAEQTLRENEERWRFALEASQIGAWDMDLADHTTFRSLEHDRIYGYPELLPQWTYEMFLEHVLPEDRTTVDGIIQRAFASQSAWSFECRILRADGCTLNTLDSEGINGYSKGHANMWSGILVRHY